MDCKNIAIFSPRFLDCTQLSLQLRLHPLSVLYNFLYEFTWWVFRCWHKLNHHLISVLWCLYRVGKKLLLHLKNVYLCYFDGKFRQFLSKTISIRFQQKKNIFARLVTGNIIIHLITIWYFYFILQNRFFIVLVHFNFLRSIGSEGHCDRFQLISEGKFISRYHSLFALPPSTQVIRFSCLVLQ